MPWPWADESLDGQRSCLAGILMTSRIVKGYRWLLMEALFLLIYEVYTVPATVRCHNELASAQGDTALDQKSVLPDSNPSAKKGGSEPASIEPLSQAPAGRGAPRWSTGNCEHLAGFPLSMA